MQCRSSSLRLPFCFFPPAFAHLLLRNLLLLECLCQDKVGLILRSASKLCNQFNPFSLCGVDCISMLSGCTLLAVACSIQAHQPVLSPRQAASASVPPLLLSALPVLRSLPTAPSARAPFLLPPLVLPTAPLLLLLLLLLRAPTEGRGRAGRKGSREGRKKRSWKKEL